MTAEQEQLVNDNMGLIGLVINRMNLRYEYEDYFEIGLIGLVKGVKSFDPSKGVTGSTYFYRCIQNEIYQYGRKIKRTLKTISIDCKISVDDLSIADTIKSEIDIEEEIIKKEQYEIIIKNINALNDREKFIILHYYGIGTNEELKEKELSKVLGISQAQVNRTKNRAIRKLKKMCN